MTEEKKTASINQRKIPEVVFTTDSIHEMERSNKDEFYRKLYGGATHENTTAPWFKKR